MGIRRFSNSKRCPICNRSDWCGWNTASSGRTYIYCMRATNVGCTTLGELVQGCDGEIYHCYGINDKGCTTFEVEAEVQQYKKNREPQNYWDTCKTVPRVECSAKKERDGTFMEPLPNDKCSEVYRAIVGMLVLEKQHKAYLMSEGWTEEMLKKHSIVSLPEDDGYRFNHKGTYVSRNMWRKELMERLLELFSIKDIIGVPGFYLQQKDNGDQVLRLNALGGILFPQYDAKGKVYRLKLRVDRRFYNGKYEDISERKFRELRESGSPCYDTGKYLQLSSAKEVELEDRYTNKYRFGTGSGSNLSYYMKSSDDFYCCWITEGEKKGSFANAKLHAPVISLPGVSSWSKLVEKDCYGKSCIEHLIERGTQIFIVALDADKELNRNVLQAQQKVVDAIKQFGTARIAVANWPMEQGKGLDDLLNAGHRPGFDVII